MFRFYLVCYDIADEKRLRRVARVMEGFGERVQKSVFECHLDRDARERMLRSITGVLQAECDSLRLYPLCARCRRDCEQIGAIQSEDLPVTWVI